MSLALLAPPIPLARAIRPHALSPLGINHTLTQDSLGFVSMCGKWRPSDSVPPSTVGRRCDACAEMERAADESTASLQYLPHQTPAELVARIRAAKRDNPELSYAKLAERFHTTEARVRRALKPRRA